MVSAYAFLRVYCRGTGYPFGPRSRWWAITVIVIISAISTGLGIAAVAASHHMRAAYVGLAVPSALWLQKPAAKRGTLEPARLAGWLTFPLRRMTDGMGDDLETWCAVRERVVAGLPRWVAEAAMYYHNQLTRLKDRLARQEMRRLRDSIRHKTHIVELIDLDTTPERVRAALQSDPATRDMGKYADDDLPRLARRLLSEAENELHRMLAYAYRHGYHDLLIYPSRTPPPGGMRWPSLERERR